MILKNDEVKMINITLEFPESAFSFMHKPPEDFANELKTTAVVKWFEEELLSQSKACEILNISRIEFINILIKHNITPFQYNENEIEDEFRS